MKKLLIFIFLFILVFPAFSDLNTLNNFIKESHIERNEDYTTLKIMDKYILEISKNDILDKENELFSNKYYKLIKITINKKKEPYKYSVVATYYVSQRFNKIKKVNIYLYYELESNEPELTYELKESEIKEFDL